MRHGFTLVEIMIIVAVIGALALFGAPIIYGAYSNSTETICARNVSEVEKAKMTLALPVGTVKGAMGIANQDQDISSNLLMVMNIDDLSELQVGDRKIQVGSLKEKARYQ